MKNREREGIFAIFGEDSGRFFVEGMDFGEDSGDRFLKSGKYSEDSGVQREMTHSFFHLPGSGERMVRAQSGTT